MNIEQAINNMFKKNLILDNAFIPCQTFGRGSCVFHAMSDTFKVDGDNIYFFSPTFQNDRDKCSELLTKLYSSDNKNLSRLKDGVNLVIGDLLNDNSENPLIQDKKVQEIVAEYKGQLAQCDQDLERVLHELLDHLFKSKPPEHNETVFSIIAQSTGLDKSILKGLRRKSSAIAGDLQKLKNSIMTIANNGLNSHCKAKNGTFYKIFNRILNCDTKAQELRESFYENKTIIKEYITTIQKEDYPISTEELAIISTALQISINLYVNAKCHKIEPVFSRLELQSIGFNARLYNPAKTVYIYYNKDEKHYMKCVRQVQEDQYITRARKYVMSIDHPHTTPEDDHLHTTPEDDHLHTTPEDDHLHTTPEDDHLHTTPEDDHLQKMNVSVNVVTPRIKKVQVIETQRTSSKSVEIQQDLSKKSNKESDKSTANNPRASFLKRTSRALLEEMGARPRALSRCDSRDREFPRLIAQIRNHDFDKKAIIDITKSIIDNLIDQTIKDKTWLDDYHSECINSTLGTKKANSKIAFFNNCRISYYTIIEKDQISITEIRDKLQKIRKASNITRYTYPPLEYLYALLNLKNSIDDTNKGISYDMEDKKFFEVAVEGNSFVPKYVLAGLLDILHKINQNETVPDYHTVKNYLTLIEDIIGDRYNNKLPSLSLLPGNIHCLVGITASYAFFQKNDGMNYGTKYAECTNMADLAQDELNHAITLHNQEAEFFLGILTIYSNLEVARQRFQRVTTDKSYYKQSQLYIQIIDMLKYMRDDNQRDDTEAHKSSAADKIKEFLSNATNDKNKHIHTDVACILAKLYKEGRIIHRDVPKHYECLYYAYLMGYKNAFKDMFSEFISDKNFQSAIAQLPEEIRKKIQRERADYNLVVDDASAFCIDDFEISSGEEDNLSKNLDQTLCLMD